MNYEFPKITHISQVLAAIEGRDEFQIKVDEQYGYTVINYMVNFEDTFPPVVDTLTAIRRECRGITFDTASGNIISRKYHKFFNIGEKPETQVDSIDWSKPYRRFKKLDGSMITPLWVHNQIHWCTKRGITEVTKPVAEWASTTENAKYHALSRHWINLGWTPIFEWCSRLQKIVVDYPTTQLVLTAIRHNETGVYLQADMLANEANVYEIPCAPFGEIQTSFNIQILDEIRNLVGEEGDIFRFENGHMLKQKGEWYSNIHKTLEHLIFEKDVIRLILDEKLDDVKPFLPEDLVSSVDKFSHSILSGMQKTASRIYWETLAFYDNSNGSKKKFAEWVEKNYTGLTIVLAFKTWDIISLGKGEQDVFEHLISLAKKHTSSQTRVNDFRMMWGSAKWTDYLSTKSEE